MNAHCSAVCVGRSLPMAESSYEASTASPPSRAYMGIDEMKRLVNCNVVRCLPGLQPPAMASLD
jgi:hypothetical protein